MKQFLTLCLASAILGSSFNVDAKMTLQEAMQLKSEGKAIKAPMKTLDRNAIKMLPASSTKAVSGFHKMMEKKADNSNAMKAPSKITSKGDNIYGYLGYSTNYDLPYGLYELENSGFSLKWEDSWVNETGVSPYGLGLQDGVVKGYALYTFWGYIFGVYFVEYDFETGELLNYKSQDLNSNINLIMGSTLDSKEGVMYGFGYYGDDYAFMSAPADDPFNYTEISVPENGCFSICYNSEDEGIYAVTYDYEFVKIDKSTGEFTKIMNLDVANGATYLTALCYDPVTKLYYWNIFYYDYTSALATIDVETKTLEIIEESSYGNEFISFLTTDEVPDAFDPVRPSVGEVDFYKNNLIGFVYFTLPEKLTNGSEIEGEIEYKAYLDGNLYSTGKAAAGSEIKVNYAVGEDGMHTFSVAAVVDGNEGAKGSVKSYVGNDTPVAPANVKLAADENGKYSVTWDAVGGVGVHGGYVDDKAITYNVTLNGEAVASTAATSCYVDIDADAELNAYTATVSAVCNGLESAPTSSNSVVEGTALSLPVYIQPDPDQYAISSVLDANEDGSTWYDVTYNGQYAIYSGWNSYNQMDEYYFLPPVKLDDPSKFYSFTMEVAVYSSLYPEEYVEVLLCNEPSPNGVQSVIIDEFSPEGEDFEKAYAEFRVRQAGDYYIAIHCTSDADQYGLFARNFTIVDNNITLDSPTAVKDLDIEADEDGALKATVSFTMPSKNLRGDDLDESSELIATVACGSNSTLVSGKPGESVSVTIATEQGNNEFVVSVALDELNSPAIYETVFTGVLIPATPDYVSAELSADRLSLYLTWPEVNESDEGDYIDPENVVYDIYLYITNWGWELYDEGVTENSYTYNADIQEYVTIGVMSRSAAGTNGYIEYTSNVVGPAYGLPIEENWDGNGEYRYEPWLFNSFDNAEEPYAAIYSSTMFGDAGSDMYCLVIQGGAGAKGQLDSPYFSTKGCSNITFVADVCGDFDLPKVTVLASAEDIEMKEVGTIVQNEAGFSNVSVTLPDEFSNKNFVNVYLQYEFENGDEVLIIESLSITSGSEIVSVANDGVKIAGGKSVVNVSGLNGENVTVADVNGRVVAKSAKAQKSASFPVEKGIYVVKAGDKNAKVVVK